MARDKQKTSSQSASPSVTFGSMPFDADQTLSSFTDPDLLIKQLAEELAISHEEARTTFKRLTHSAATASLMLKVEDVQAHVATVFASERVELTEAKAREIVLAYFRGEKYQGAKELVVAAAAYVKARDLLGAIANGSGVTWSDAYTAFELATWICASGIHNQLEVMRGTSAATRARQSATLERIDRLVAALAEGLVKMTPAAVVRWRKESNTPANYERARRDLRQAQRTLAARKTR
jgi:hypothetical protein